MQDKLYNVNCLPLTKFSRTNYKYNTRMQIHSVQCQEQVIVYIDNCTKHSPAGAVGGSFIHV